MRSGWNGKCKGPEAVKSQLLGELWEVLVGGPEGGSLSLLGGWEREGVASAGQSAREGSGALFQGAGEGPE